MSPTGDLLVTMIFRWGGYPLSLLRESRMLPWHCTLLRAAYPEWVTTNERERERERLIVPVWPSMKRLTMIGVLNGRLP